jgi:hypothetical protein
MDLTSMKNDAARVCGVAAQRQADFQAGLRCHDVHAGLRNVDPNSATLAPPGQPGLD